MYYKIIKDGIVIDAVEGSPWVCLGKHGYPVRCEPDRATGVISSDSSIIYHIDGAAPLGDYQDVIVADIGWQEYDELRALLDDGETVPVPEPVIPEPEPEPEPEPDQPVEEKPMSVQEMRERIMEQDRQIAELTDQLAATKILLGVE